MTVTAPELFLSAVDFEAIRARSILVQSPITRARTIHRTTFDVELLVRDRDELLAALAAEAQRHNGLADRLLAVHPQDAPAPIELTDEETASAHADSRSFDILGQRAVLEMIARDIADTTRFGLEEITAPMRDRSALLWGRGATARRLLAVEEATIDLYRICALHGVAVGP